ncbi:class I SAM-dependent methyltransferase [Candidatus Absconditicoccus praedator]|uniref:class I SAM-dependent methyltransferase n=1 Tax=Candidatus Absconditicoccus praedator TaxID=2735562 RepID=UPI001E59925C|nr:class I SAM-dependent methyltransferase [Candidatus Absconditicoccus praedator]UFX83205.1 class I SAM-dependent methyltransferase [Candidatus Absconditicoccus praedator]
MHIIKNLLLTNKPQNCLEVGSAIGYSIIFQASIINNRGGKIIGFEISTNSYRQALNNVFRSNLNNILLINYNFTKFPINQIINDIDFIFIDARKAEYLDCLLKIMPYLKEGSLVVFDDVMQFKDKIHNLYSFIKKNQLIYEIISSEKSDGILIIYF